jgi:DNA-binding transcriptional LysR family regulator
MPFDGRLLAGLSVLAAVVESGSFVRAADALGLSASGVSRAIARLEGRVGVRLLDRTTRSVSLTDEGRRFFEQVSPLMAGIEEAAILASGAAGAVRGRLRVNVDPLFLRVAVASRLPEFLSRYPDLSLELITRDSIGDLVAEGFDLAIRFTEPTQGGFIARKLFDTPVLTVAAPSYLARHGHPTHPWELASHHCLHFRNPATGRAFEWEFHRGSEVLPLDLGGRLLLSDPESHTAAIVAGAGIAQVLAFSAQPLIDSGALVQLFPEWCGETYPLYALYPSRHLPPAKVRAFVDFCLEAVVR